MRVDQGLYMQHVGQRFAGGTNFSDCRCSTAVCQASRAIFTFGQYAFRTGIHDNSVAVSMTNINNGAIIKWMHDAGYYTGFIGKTMLGAGTAAFTGLDFRRTFTNATEQEAYNFQVRTEAGTTVTPALQYQTEYIAAQFDAFIAGATEPWFAWVTPSNPHIGLDLLQIPAPHDVFEFSEVYWDTQRLVELADASSWPSWISGLSALFPSTKALIREQARKALQECLSLDRMIESMFARLDTAGMANDTVVILTSDNGVMIGEQRCYGVSPAYKNCPYEASVRVPLLVVGPGFNTGRTIRTPTMIQDITATCIDVGGASPNLTQDGTSLATILAGASSAGIADRTCLYESWGGDTGGSPPDLPNAQGCNAVVAGNRWKFTRYEGKSDPDKYELTDLTADPTEQVNQALAGGAYLTMRNALEAATDAILAS